VKYSPFAHIKLLFFTARPRLDRGCKRSKVNCFLIRENIDISSLIVLLQKSMRQAISFAEILRGVLGN
jgi:hypothetical protein